MLKAIERFYKKRIARKEGGQTSREATGQTLMLATAALLIEIAKADCTVTVSEEKTIARAIEKTFELSKEATDELIVMAEEEVRESVSFYQFTHLINKGFSYDKKIEIVELLWQVVFADHEMEKHEEYFVRKIADLLHVSHRDLMTAKQKTINAI